MRNTRDRFVFPPLTALALSVATGGLTAQGTTRFLANIPTGIESVVSDGAQNTVFGFNPNWTTGLMETFSWDGAAWTLINASGTIPAMRNGQAMAGAPGGGVLMIGGSSFTTTPVSNATHLFNGGAWTALTPTPSPSLRSGAGCAQLGNGKVVLFGGLAGVALNDTWVFDATNTWTLLNITGPSARLFPAMGADGNGKVLLFGGMDSNGGFLSDTWSFDGTSWTQLFPSTTPPARFAAAMTADPKVTLAGVQRSSVVLAGGHAPGVLTDVWVFDFGNWTLQTFTAPANHSTTTCALDGVHREIVFAGTPASGPATPYLVGEFGFTTYGNGCACPNTSPVMVPSATAPQIGNQTSFDVAAGESNAGVFLVISFAPANTPITPICTQWVASGGTTTFLQLSAIGSGSVQITIPNSLGFVGLTMFAQMFDIIPAHSCVSNGIEMRVGR